MAVVDNEGIGHIVFLHKRGHRGDSLADVHHHDALEIVDHVGDKGIAVGLLEYYYILANESGDNITAKFTGFAEKQLNVIFNANPVKVNNGAFELKLEPYAVRVMSAEKFDAPDKIWQKSTYRPWSAKIKNDVRK